MLIKSISVSGYQSLYNVKVECGNFTVIYGESDVGKSAFYRSIRAFLTAESGDSFISRGEETAKVSIDLDLGLGVTVAWKKKKGRSCDYSRKSVTSDQNWLRCKQMPDDIANDLRITPIVVDGEKFYPNLRGQFDVLFMLFESSTKRARLLGSLISNILLLGLKAANLEKLRNDSDIRALEGLADDIEKRRRFNFVEFGQSVSAARKILDWVSSRSTVYDKLQSLLKEQESLSQFKKLEFSPLPEELFKYLSAAVDKHFTLESLLATKKSFEEQIVRLQTSIEQIMNEMDKVDKERLEIGKKLTIACPHCGGAVPIAELEI